MASISSNAFSVSGLATGLDTAKLIEGMLAIQQSKIDLLKGKQTTVVAQQSAFAAVETQLLTLQEKLDPLAKTVNGVFDSKTAVSGDTTLVTAAASAIASPGTYSLHVNQLARSHQIASQGFASLDSEITEGTIQIGLGAASSTITIDASNNTLQGLADAINLSGAGVSAGIINDGSAQPYRLLLTATKTGTSNSIALVNNLAPDSGTAVRPDFAITLQEAADASVTLGSGAGALTITNASNQLDGLISGVIVNLHGADPAKEITLTIDNDTAKARTAVLDFVDSYNDLMEFVDEITKYQNGAAGILQGNHFAISMQDQVSNAALDKVAGLKQQMNHLSSVGITVNDKGQLEVDESKLDDALAGKVAGTTYEDVRRLFALTDSQSTNSGVKFISGSAKTKASTTPYQVDVTQAATQGSITGTNTLAPSIDIVAGVNDTFTIEVDGKTSNTLTIGAGTYTQAEIIQAVQTLINADSQLGAKEVTVGLSTDRMTISSKMYGSVSEVTIGAGTAVTALGFNGTETGQGQDVAGNYIVDGQVEAAVGTGQFLKGLSTNANTADLQVRVTLTPTQIVAGHEAEITITRGIASKIDIVLDGLLDPVNGRIKAVTDGLQDDIDNVQDAIDRQNEIFELKREALVKQFAALEKAVSLLKATGDYLAAQFKSLPSTQK